MERIPMTPEGHASLSEDLRRFKSVERPQIIRAIEEARAHGDLSENAEYHAAKEAQDLNERRIADLEDKLRRAEVIDVDKLSGDKVTFGAWVTLREEASGRERQLQIVDEAEADMSQNRISVNSPMARAMIRHGVGETIEVVAPAGARLYKILSVGYGAAAAPKPAAKTAPKANKANEATEKGDKGESGGNPTNEPNTDSGAEQRATTPKTGKGWTKVSEEKKGKAKTAGAKSAGAKKKPEENVAAKKAPMKKSAAEKPKAKKAGAEKPVAKKAPPAKPAKKASKKPEAKSSLKKAPAAKAPKKPTTKSATKKPPATKKPSAKQKTAAKTAAKKQ